MRLGQGFMPGMRRFMAWRRARRCGPRSGAGARRRHCESPRRFAGSHAACRRWARGDAAPACLGELRRVALGGRAQPGQRPRPTSLDSLRHVRRRSGRGSIGAGRPARPAPSADRRAAGDQAPEAGERGTTTCERDLEGGFGFLRDRTQRNAQAIVAVVAWVLWFDGSSQIRVGRRLSGE